MRVEMSGTRTVPRHGPATKIPVFWIMQSPRALLAPLIVLATLAIQHPLAAQRKAEFVGSWSRTYSDREGRPSKCDCDYHSWTYVLEANGKASFRVQQGRLSPVYFSDARGTWEMLNDSTIVLRLREFGGIRPLAEGGKKAEPEEFRKTLHWDPALHRMRDCDGEELR